jgi:peptidoglycan LD-endopeptidase LytH
MVTTLIQRELRKWIIFLVILCCLYPPNIAQAKVQAHEVSVRHVFESMGYKIIREGKYIKLTREQDDEILLQSNSKKALKNGQIYTLTKPIRFDKQINRNMISVLDIYGLAKEEKKEKHYRVSDGDSLDKISKRFEVSIDELRTWNHLTTDLIVPGQHLHIKDPIYTVKAGDSIWEIAHMTESSIEDIKRGNNLLTDIVMPGQKLFIPTQPSLQPPSAFKDGIFPLAQETYQPYGNNYGDGRSFSTNGLARTHEGIDIMAPNWTPVFSVTEGTIVKYGWNTYGGYRITIKEPTGITFYYAHFSGYPPGLKKGQRVSKGQLIGYIGATGYGKKGTNGKFASHLHFGMYAANGKAMNPYSYLKWWEIKP